MEAWENTKLKTQFEPGEVIFKEGEAGDCAYIVEKGRAEISVLREGKKVTLGIVGPGDLFGEMALINNELRSATTIAIDQVILIKINQTTFKRQLADTDPLVTLFLRALLDRFQEVRSNLLSQADNESSRIKNPPNHNSHYEADKAIAVKDIEFEAELEQALEHQEFELHYQPIVNLENLAIHGFEALLRWRHPTRGLIAPEKFVQFTETTGLIVPIGNWIFTEACRAQKELAELFPYHPLFISINLSTKQFAESDLVSTVAEAIQENDVDPRRIKLEVTETLLLDNPEYAATTLKNLKKIGITLAVDDFGTGYSSFNYLNRFPLDCLKIDKSFIDTMTSDERSAEIVRTLSQLAHNLGMVTIAEGVETQQQVEKLRNYQCDYGQGNIVSRAVPFEGVKSLLNHQAI